MNYRMKLEFFMRELVLTLVVYAGLFVCIYFLRSLVKKRDVFPAFVLALIFTIFASRKVTKFGNDVKKSRVTITVCTAISVFLSVLIVCSVYNTDLALGAAIFYSILAAICTPFIDFLVALHIRRWDGRLKK